MCLRTDMSNVFHNDDSEMRTPESFDRHVESGEISDQFVKEYGVKKDFDAAHDFLEGVIPYILTSVVIKFVEKSFFTLEDFNDV